MPALQPLPTFSVDLVDHYGHVGIAEQGGLCRVVSPAGTAADGAGGPGAQTQNSEETLVNGTATYRLMQVTGARVGWRA